ncbi:MAG: hypothetical protein H0T53_02355 [Herpetosiphonaceae bacterium]|nr:hypothetical protein [Herpetosiphonaceae bacterium]
MRSTIAIHIPQLAIWTGRGDYSSSEYGVAAESDPAPDQADSCGADTPNPATWSKVQLANQSRPCIYCVHPISVGEAYCSMLIADQPAPIYAHYSCTED